MTSLAKRMVGACLIGGLHLAANSQAQPSRDIKGGGLFFYDPVNVFHDGSLLPGKENYEPSLAKVGGATWLAMLEFTPALGDRIVVGVLDEGFRLTQRRIVTPLHGKYRRPTLTTDTAGQLWLSYERKMGNRWALFLIRADAGGGKAELISGDAAHAINHTVTELAMGGLAFAWQQDVGGQWDVLARRRDGLGRWSGEQNLTVNNPLGDWHPKIVSSKTGKTAVAWDAYDGVSFSIRLKRGAGAMAWEQKTVRVTDSDVLEARASAAFDNKDRLFVAWEEGGPNWGKEYRNFQDGAPTITDSNGGVHRFRYTRLAEVLTESGGGETKRIAVPMPSFAHGRERDDVRPGTQRLGVFYERPQLTVDGNNRLWLVNRHFFFPAASTSKPRIISHKEEGWRLYARCLADGRWSEAVGLEPNQRDGVQRLSLLPGRNGLTAAWAVGRTHRGQPSDKRGVALSKVAWSEKLKWSMPGAEEPGVSGNTSNGSNKRAPQAAPTEVAGTKFQVYFGDLHRHTDLSLCRVYFDGSLDDIYRYAIEAAEHDFLGVTDHARDIANGNAKSQLWWRSVKEVTRHQLSGTFFPMFSFERSHGETDHNVVSLREDVLRPHNPLLKEFWKEIGPDTITIPHNPIRPTRAFAYRNDAKRPLLEIYQGCRGNPMHGQAHYALKQGHHMGFIASSDHLSTSGSYACVWSPEPGREGIFRSMQARRTYGATAPIRLIFRAGNDWMGSILQRDDVPTFQYEVEGTAALKEIDVVRDGTIVRTIANNGDGRVMTGELSGLNPLNGKTWVYLRVKQHDGQKAWSSPIWVE